MKAIRILSVALMMLAANGSIQVDAAQTGLEQAFFGRAVGRGRFQSAIIGLDRRFLVTTSGHQSGDQFVLDQIFRFDDGHMDRRTWRFRKIGPGRYAGTRQDVVGEADVRVEPDAIHLSYNIDMKQKSGVTVRLHFEDRIERGGRGAILNRAVIYAMGLPVGSVETTLIRQ
ncbi:DUF3833 family protein [Kaistia dalseonensis]|uniref:DUF3833 family protein n=1 Tax=Kaistia dalseonensis TaxID=410840 RepID=A0ABU0H5I3_9HYPH|nr:DUF3833 family protein [Kaistia dalseonensis]MCX5494990.1 DUF3833 family protein [Kaistia dalseonensis]MDQ0437571.1 hypothetical protein [Kaistia dalseonensis]